MLIHARSIHKVWSVYCRNKKIKTMEIKYEALDKEGKSQAGTISAATQDAAIEMLQRRGLTITAISGSKEKGFIETLSTLSFFGGISSGSMTILSRQIASLFEAQISALRIFKLLAEQADKPFIRGVLVHVSDDLQAGVSISKALEKYPSVFSDFYVNMVRAGEESGKLSQTFMFLADYVERSDVLTSKVRNALIYPSFILLTFVTVMVLMLTFIIPKIGAIIIDSGQQLPFLTQMILNLSTFLVDYGIFLLIAFIVGGYFLFRFSQTQEGKLMVDKIKISTPYIGTLYQKLYLARFADNMSVMLMSGISAVRSLEITSSVVDNEVYATILEETVYDVKAGTPMSRSLSRHTAEIPVIMVQMIQIGEETGDLGGMLTRMAKFYNHEVNTAVDTLVSLIEPVLIVTLAVGVGFLLASVLLPIYNSVGGI